jgi:hypothetical protein
MIAMFMLGDESFAILRRMFVTRWAREGQAAAGEKPNFISEKK